MAEPVILIGAPAELRIECAGTFLSLPEKVASAVLDMARESAYGSVTLHFKAGRICGLDTEKKERIGNE